MVIRNKFLFYFLSFTWGLPLTLIGCIIAAIMLLTGHKPQKWGYCWYFEVGTGWGGLELGVFFLVNKNSSARIRNHEHGHAHQNCIWGILFPFVIAIPSAARYWYRIIRAKIGRPCKTSYYSVWFESQASTLGENFMKWC